MEASPLFLNGIDSLRVGMNYYNQAHEPHAHKHAILTIFHSIEMFLKEYLFQVNPILIYRNIDKSINEDSITVGIDEILVRLENLGTGIPEDEKKILKKMRQRRNRIEHHRYEIDEENEIIIEQSLKFVTFFVEEILGHRLADHLDATILNEVRGKVHNHTELWGLAEFRLQKWLKVEWPNWDWIEYSIPDEFTGTLPCPVCKKDFLVIEHLEKPECFYCNSDIDAAECNECGGTYIKSIGCQCRHV